MQTPDIILGNAMAYMNEQSPRDWVAVEILSKAWGRVLLERSTLPALAYVRIPKNEWAAILAWIDSKGLRTEFETVRDDAV